MRSRSHQAPQVGVQGLERGKGAGVGHERVAAHVADQVLDRALLVAARRRAEAGVEQVVGPQALKRSCSMRSGPERILVTAVFGLSYQISTKTPPKNCEGLDVTGEEGFELLGG